MSSAKSSVKSDIATCEKCGDFFAPQNKNDKLCWLCKNGITIYEFDLSKSKNVKKVKKDNL
jgi:uncharacterized OB-fold protein